jgi:hypothetical protein
MRTVKYPLITLGASLMLVAALAVASVGPAAAHDDAIVRVRDINDPPRNPVQATLSYRSDGGFKGYTVPAGKRLVIEHVSGFVSNNGDGALAGVNLDTVAEGKAATHYFPMTHEAHLLDYDSFAFGGPARLYVDGATTIQLSVGVAGANSTTRVVLIGSFSGYLVNAQ